MKTIEQPPSHKDREHIFRISVFLWVTIQVVERCFTDLECGCADYLGRSAPEVNFQSTVNEATAPIGV